MLVAKYRDDHRTEFLRSDEEAKSFDLIADEPVFHFLDWLERNGFVIVSKDRIIR